MFKIDPKVYSSMFSLPSENADKGLKFASGEQLKFIICIFKNPEADIDEIAKKTNLSLDVIKECAEYWRDAGILASDEVTKAVNT